MADDLPPDKAIANDLAMQQLYQMQQQAMHQGSMGSSMYGTELKGNPALIQWQLDCQALLATIEKRLKRLTAFDENTGTWSRAENEKGILPDEAVDLILFTLDPILNHNTLLSWLKDKTVGQIVTDIIDDIDLYLLEHKFEFKLATKTDINMILNPIQIMLFALFNRSVGFKTLDTVGKNYTVTESTSSLGVNSQKGGGGLFGNLPFLHSNRN